MEECGPCPIFASFTLAFALKLRKKHGTRRFFAICIDSGHWKQPWTRWLLSALFLKIYSFIILRLLSTLFGLTKSTCPSSFQSKNLHELLVFCPLTFRLSTSEKSVDQLKTVKLLLCIIYLLSRKKKTVIESGCPQRNYTSISSKLPS